MTPAVSCALAEKWISLSIDGELSPSLEHELEAHLDACSRCRKRFDEYVEEERLLDAELGRVAGEMEHLLEGRLDERTIAEREYTAFAAAVRPEGARRASRSKLRALQAALAAAAIIVGAAVYWRAASEPLPEAAARVAWLGNGVQLRKEGAEFVPAAPARGLLYVGETMRAEEGAHLGVQFPDGSSARVRSGEFTVRRDGSATILALSAGSVEFEVQSGTPEFRVETPAAQIRVLGTRFRVEHDESSETTRVSVTEGIVRVEAVPFGKSLPFPVEEGEAVRVFPVQRGSGRVWVTRTETEASGGARTGAAELAPRQGADPRQPQSATERRGAADSPPTKAAPPAPDRAAPTAPLDMPPKELPAKDKADDGER